MLRTGARERLSGGVWSQAGIRVVPDCGLQEIAAVMLPCVPPTPTPQAWHNLFPGQGPAGADWRSLGLPSVGKEQAGWRGPCS